MSQSRPLLSWLPLERCIVACEMNRCDMSAAFDRYDGRCYLHGKIHDGLFAAWHPAPVAPQRLHEIRPADFEPRRYDYDAWFDGELHVLTQGIDFVPAIGSMATAIRGAALRRHIGIDLKCRGPRDGSGTIHLQALAKQETAA